MSAPVLKRGRPKSVPVVTDQLLEPLCVRASEACRLLSIGPTTLWKLVKQGRLRTIKVGPQITLIETAELRRLLAEHAAPPPEQNAAEE